MAMTEAASDHADRPGRRRPFATWVKKLTHFKGGATADAAPGPKRHLAPMRIAARKRASKKNNPYPLSGYTTVQHADSHYARGPGSHTSYTTSHVITSSRGSLEDDDDETDSQSRRETSSATAPSTTGAPSVAATTAWTDQDGRRSLVAPSNGAASSITGTTATTGTAGTATTVRTPHSYGRSGGGGGGGDSTFSSPAPSLRSLATTLTTIPSLAPVATAPSGGASLTGVSVGHGGHPSLHHGHHPSTGSQMIHFHQPFPNTPVSAIPSHLATPSGAPGGPGHPTTYTMATANNLLTDNASILTLASSSQRRRRRSLDTDASVRALAPSSLFGGSRESLPLSVLSANVEAGSGANGNGNGASAAGSLALHTTSSRMSVAATAERTSIYSTTGILAGDRSSYYARQTGSTAGMVAASSSNANGGGGDAASIRSGRSGRSGGSGLLGHSRSESITGSMGGSLASPLVSPLASPLASPLEAGEPEGGEREEKGREEKEEREEKKEKGREEKNEKK